MSAQRFLDDLARALAEPMSRRRAVQVVGVTLVAAAAGVRPRVARAQTGTCLKTTCGKDQRCCQKFTAAGTETYCCPRPSWQFQCGSESNGYRCVNTCKPGGRNFACTALIAHPESGINGVCCDRRIHSGCAPIGRPAEKRPDGTRAPSEEWKPSCCLKGPGFGFCGGVCCEPPNRCKNGECRCPDGTLSIDGRHCCKRGEHPAECVSAGTGFIELATTMDASLVGRKCCPSAKPNCCGATCCAEFGCCGRQCCSHKTSRCATWEGKKTCCPKRRMTVVGNEQICCPVGTISIVLGFPACCPPTDPKCCGWPNSEQVQCGPNQVCVRGSCVTV